MSKKTASAAAAAVERNQKTKKAWIISIICVITAIVIAVSLIIALWEEPTRSLAPTENDDVPSSTLTINNGNFEYINEGGTLYPKTAQGWNKYQYKAPTKATSQGYTTVSGNADTLMGIIDTDSENWGEVENNLAQQNLPKGTVANPGKPDSESKDNNVYMIHNFNDTTASIYSRSFSIPASTSVKISVWLKTENITGAGAFVMIKYNSSSAVKISSTDVQNWYAYKFGIKETKNTDGAAGWQKFEFYVFNQTASSKNVYANIGLGNVYANNYYLDDYADMEYFGAEQKDAKGTLFVDEISYETVTANDYREQYEHLATATQTEHTAYVIEKETTSSELSRPAYVTTGLTTFDTESYLTNALSQKDNKAYSPFVIYSAEEIAADENKKKQTIVQLSNDGTKTDEIGVTTNAITIAPPSTGSQYHISLWTRVIGNNKLANANIYLIDESGEIISSSSFTALPVDDIVKSDNNGWVQYHFYIKPAKVEKTVNILVTFGVKGGYAAANPEAVPNGTVLATEPIVEKITQQEYADVSSGSYAKKTDLSGTAATTSVANGSFTNYVANSGADFNGLFNPSDWTPVFAGSNLIYKDGRDVVDGEFHDSVTVPHGANAVSAGIRFLQTTDPNATLPDDSAASAVLEIKNNLSTSFGYLSNELSLAANNIVVLSVLAKGDGSAIPYVYLYENMAKSEGVVYKAFTANAANKTDDDKFNLPAAQNGYTRYYFVIATGDTARTVRLALFNGAIDAKTEEGVSTGTQSGTVYFDQAMMTAVSTYTRDNTDEEIYDKDGNIIDEKVKEITYTATAGYEEFDLDDLLKAEAESAHDNLAITDYRFTDVTKPVEEDEEEGGTTEPNGSTADAGLIISIISSSVLVAALLIVVVVKIFFKKKRS